MSNKNIVPKNVLKIDGSEQKFSTQKITGSIWQAAKIVGGKNKKQALVLSDKVVALLKKTNLNGEVIQTSEIGEAVEKILIESGHARTAKTYIRHREKQKTYSSRKRNIGN